MHLLEEIGRLLTPGEAAMILHKDPKTLRRWEMVGKISCLRTIGGHRRYREVEVLYLRDNPPKRRRRSDAGHRRRAM